MGGCSPRAGSDTSLQDTYVDPRWRHACAYCSLYDGVFYGEAYPQLDPIDLSVRSPASVFTSRRNVAERSLVMAPIHRRRAVRATIRFRLTSLQWCLISRRRNATKQTLQFPFNPAPAIASAPRFASVHMARPTTSSLWPTDRVSWLSGGGCRPFIPLSLRLHVPKTQILFREPRTLKQRSLMLTSAHARTAVLVVNSSLNARSQFRIRLHSTLHARPSNVDGATRNERRP